MCYILGRSGSGKSTLLHILGGLDQPTSGTVYVEQVPLHTLSEKKRAAIRNMKVGFVFQFYYLLPELSVWDNVALPARIARKKSFNRTVDELLALVGLTERASHLPQQLSGGEMQRAALARALVNEPDVVFCDEPTGNLDETSARTIYRLIADLNTRNKQAFCIVTHEESLVRDKEYVYRLKDGVLTR
jgi:lipoprotein-releasing system ATP-binding protein